jgi:hypothetical protein
MAEGIRKSALLNLSFPYDWSNPNISDDALILNVLKRGIYEDICRVCACYGLDAVERHALGLREPPYRGVSLARMLSNIKKGFARAQTERPSRANPAPV